MKMIKWGDITHISRELYSIIFKKYKHKTKYVLYFDEGYLYRWWPIYLMEDDWYDNIHRDIEEYYKKETK